MKVGNLVRHIGTKVFGLIIEESKDGCFICVQHFDGWTSWLPEYQYEVISESN